MKGQERWNKIKELKEQGFIAEEIAPLVGLGSDVAVRVWLSRNKERYSDIKPKMITPSKPKKRKEIQPRKAKEEIDKENNIDNVITQNDNANDNVITKNDNANDNVIIHEMKIAAEEGDVNKLASLATRDVFERERDVLRIDRPRFNFVEYTSLREKLNSVDSSLYFDWLLLNRHTTPSIDHVLKTYEIDSQLVNHFIESMKIFVRDSYSPFKTEENIIRPDEIKLPLGKDVFMGGVREDVDVKNLVWCVLADTVHCIDDYGLAFNLETSKRVQYFLQNIPKEGERAIISFKDGLTFSYEHRMGGDIEEKTISNVKKKMIEKLFRKGKRWNYHFVLWLPEVSLSAQYQFWERFAKRCEEYITLTNDISALHIILRNYEEFMIADNERKQELKKADTLLHLRIAEEERKRKFY